MIDHEDRTESQQYGPWPWIVGFALGGVLMVLMFTLATGRL